MRTLRLPLLACLVAGAATLLLTGCGRKHETAANKPLPVVPVRTQTVTSKSLPAVEEVVGTVRARLRSALEAKVSGRIEKFLVAPGQSVKSGELLVQVGAREIQARLDQAVALREQARGDLKRFTELLRRETITQAEFDATQARFRVTQAAAAEAETMLGYARITAPFDGVVTRKLADVGDLATPGRPLLELEDPASLRFEADVPETLIGRLAQGAVLQVRMATLTNNLAITLSEIAPAADPNSRTYLVKGDLPPGVTLRAGQFGRVAVPVGETTALRVPTSAVVQRGQMELVFVIVGGQAQLRLVRAGKRAGNELEIVSGLQPGEVVVIEGAAQLRDGQPVQLKP